jgi:hypothetical protein
MHRLGDRLAYVVDSAAFKQDRFTPATHVPVRSPAELKSDPGIRAVIVMGASYSDEIRRTLRNDYSPALSVAILRPAHLETDAVA